MGLQSILYERVLYPIHWISQGPLYGIDIINILKNLNMIQWWPEAQIRDYQNKKLQRLITHAYNNIPYYRRVMQERGITPAEIRTRDDLEFIPVLTKQIIRDNFNDMNFRGMNNRQATKRSTSGTTGDPLVFYQDRNSRIWVHAAMLRGWSWAKYKIGDILVSFYNLGRLSFWGKINSTIIRHYYFPANDNENKFAEFFNKIRSLKPAFVTGFTSSLYLYAKTLEKNNFPNITIPVIFTCAEMLHDYQRKLIEKAFNGRVYDYYGSNEMGSIAYECEHGNKHISEEHVILEIVNSNGEAVRNRSGNIVVTDLDNFAMPFIRYRIGDVGSMSDRVCDCGRNLQILDSLDGRSQEFLKASDGSLVPGIYFPGRFREIKGINQFQIIQEDLKNMVIKIVKSKNYSASDLNNMIEIIKDKLGTDMNINVKEVVDIAPTYAGKRRLVISHVPTEF